MKTVGGATGAYSRRGFVQAATAGVLATSTAVGHVAAQSGENESNELAQYEWKGYKNQGLAGSTSISGISGYDRTHFSVGNGEYATSPSIADGTVYIGVDEQLIATDIQNGSGEWVYEANNSFIQSTAVTNDTVVGVTNEGEVIAVNREDGTERWGLTVSGQPGFPTASDGVIYVGDHEGAIYAFEAQSGDLQWRTDLDADANSGDPTASDRPTVTVGEERLYANIPYSNSPPSRIEALSFEGESEWTYEKDLDSFGELYPVSLADQGLCITSENELSVISKTGGIEQWSTEIPIAERSAAVGHGYVAVGVGGNFSDYSETFVQLYDIESGEEQWSFTVSEGNAPGSVTIAGEYVYYTTIINGGAAAIKGIGLEDGLERFSLEVEYPDGRDYGPIPIPNGLFVPDNGSTRLLVNDSFGGMSEESGDDSSDSDQSTSNQEPAEDGEGTSETGASDQTGSSTNSETTQRGLFTNDGDMFSSLDSNRSMFGLTIGGLALSAVTLLYQLKEGE
jgi:outer membrane protein assembly factor BamB